MSVRVERRESMNLLGLILARIIERNLARGVRPPRSGVVSISAGGMECAVAFGEGGPIVRRGRPERVDLRLEGDLPALVAVARSPVRAGLAAVLRGRLRLRGRPLLLLAVLRLLRAAPEVP